MILLIAPDWYAPFADELHDMHRLRYRVFRQRLGWDVRTRGGYEIDAFDALKPHYLLLQGRDGCVNGCVRLLPSTGPTMLRDTFSLLLDGISAPQTPDIWESSRFAVDLPRSAPKGAGGIALGTYELLVGMTEFGLSRGIRRIVTVTDLRMERILRRAGWPLERIARPSPVGTTRALAGFLEISGDHLNAMRRNGGIDGPVLWRPVMSRAG